MKTPECFPTPDTQKPRLRRGLGVVGEVVRVAHRGGVGCGMAASVAGRGDVGKWFVRFRRHSRRLAI